MFFFLIYYLHQTFSIYHIVNFFYVFFRLLLTITSLSEQQYKIYWFQPLVALIQKVQLIEFYLTARDQYQLICTSFRQFVMLLANVQFLMSWECPEENIKSVPFRKSISNFNWYHLLTKSLVIEWQITPYIKNCRMNRKDTVSEFLS